MRHWFRRALIGLANPVFRWAGIRAVIIGPDDAAFVLPCHSAGILRIPADDRLAASETTQVTAVLVTAAAILLRDHEDNLTFYEAVVRAAGELGLGPERGRRIAGHLINPHLDEAETPGIPVLAVGETPPCPSR
jgi:hypothetical protein